MVRVGRRRSFRNRAYVGGIASEEFAARGLLAIRDGWVRPAVLRVFPGRYSAGFVAEAIS